MLRVLDDVGRELEGDLEAFAELREGRGDGFVVWAARDGRDAVALVQPIRAPGEEQVSG